MANGTQTTTKPDERTATTKVAGHTQSKGAAVHGRAAADASTAHDHIAVTVPLLGEVKLPHPNNVAFYAGVGALVAFELLEWPAAVALAVGHALVGQQQNRRLREFGEALEDV